MEEGWKRRMVASEPRLSEVVEAYEHLGFEVRLEPIGPDDPYWDEDGCTVCLEDEAVANGTRVVYTRPTRGAAPNGSEDELFD